MAIVDCNEAFNHEEIASWKGREDESVSGWSGEPLDFVTMRMKDSSSWEEPNDSSDESNEDSERKHLWDGIHHMKQGSIRTSMKKSLKHQRKWQWQSLGMTGDGKQKETKELEEKMGSLCKSGGQEVFGQCGLK